MTEGNYFIDEVVPRGTPQSNCKWCGAPIYWIERESRDKKAKVKKTVRVPVDCEVSGGEEPDSFSPGKGANHHKTCPKASEH